MKIADPAQLIEDLVTQKLTKEKWLEMLAAWELEPQVSLAAPAFSDQPPITRITQINLRNC
jgi:hypothetical protein